METPNFNALLRLVSYMKHHPFSETIYIEGNHIPTFEEVVEEYALEVFNYAEVKTA